MGYCKSTVAKPPMLLPLQLPPTAAAVAAASADSAAAVLIL